MRKEITIAAEPRALRGKNEARRLRVTHMIPAVVYGTGKEPVAISVNPKEVNKILHSSSGHNTIFDVEIPGVEKTPVMVVDWQNHPVKGSLMHIDLQRIDMTKRLTVKVPVHTHGEPKGVKQQGGIFEVITRDIEIECLPDDIPERFQIDVVEMLIGSSLRASDVPLTGTMKLVSPADQVLAHVIVTRGAEEESTEAAAAVPGAAAAAEPEVIKKGKKEEAEEEKKKK